jgi:integrase
MAILPGLRLGPYEILSGIGAGGMGEVYRAAVLTGMRIGEILALRWKRVDTQRGTLEVAETFSGGAFGLPKTRSSYRVIPMSEFLMSVLETYCAGKPSNSP